MRRKVLVKLMLLGIISGMLVACKAKETETGKNAGKDTVKTEAGVGIWDRIKMYQEDTELWKAVFEESPVEPEFSCVSVDDSHMILVVRNGKAVASNRKYVVLFGTSDLRCDWFYTAADAFAVSVDKKGDMLLSIEGARQEHGYREIRNIENGSVIASESTELNADLQSTTTYTWAGNTVEKSEYEKKMAELAVADWQVLEWTTGAGK